MMFAIPAIKGLEFGAGFAAAAMYGSQHNDSLISADGKTPPTMQEHQRRHHQLQRPCVQVCVKPTSSTHQKQRTFNIKTNEMTDLELKGGTIPA
jgi:chorismate synthase